VQNTGSLLVEDLTLTADTTSVIAVEDLVCQLQSDTPAGFTFGSGSVLQPGQAVECSTEYTVTPADIEARSRTVVFTVAGTAASGVQPYDSAYALMGTEPRLTLELDLRIDQCTQPLEPGDAPCSACLGGGCAFMASRWQQACLCLIHVHHSAKLACWASRHAPL
jgi:hypothetical protein